MSSGDFGLPPATLAALRGIFAACSKVDTAILYGSRAKGTYKPGSDIDITLTGKNLGYDELSQLAGALEESSIPYQVDLSIRAHITNPALLEHMDRVGKVLYRREAQQ